MIARVRRDRTRPYLRLRSENLRAESRLSFAKTACARKRLIFLSCLFLVLAVGSITIALSSVTTEAVIRRALPGCPFRSALLPGPRCWAGFLSAFRVERR